MNAVSNLRTTKTVGAREFRHRLDKMLRHSWFWSRAWQKAEREVDREVEAGRVRRAGSVEELLSRLKA